MTEMYGRNWFEGTFFKMLALGGALAIMNTAGGSVRNSSVDQLSEIQHRFLYVQQGWGVMGIDVAAHATGQTPHPLRINKKEYSRGLGHHAPGEIIIDLNGEYELFEAEVGVQWQGGNVGSVVFQVFVDDEKLYDSGVMRETDDPKLVRVPVAGAAELRLVVTDAGDGITCDCANWAEAKLIRSKILRKVADQLERVDVAQFARVVTSDPNRKHGTLASRIQEFPAEDVFLDEQIALNPDDAWNIPSYSRLGCIGLLWIEDRRLKEIGIEFSQKIPADKIRAEYWSGQSQWQGEWLPISSPIVEDGNAYRIQIDYRQDPNLRNGTRKIRWIITDQPDNFIARRLWAFTNSRWTDAELSLVHADAQSSQRAKLEVYNGVIVAENHVTTQQTWSTDKPLSLRVRYSKPRPWKSDRTVLRLALPNNSFGVAMDDLIENGCIYVKDAGVLVSCKPDVISIKEYLKIIEGRKTIQQRVREMPDQMLSEALAKTRNPIQSAGPTMVSLACDNIKFVVTREGAIQFSLDLAPPADRPPDEAVYKTQIRPAFDTPNFTVIRRYLYGEWLPAPVIESTDGSANYTQRTFVVPFGNQTQSEEHGWLCEKPLCVCEFCIENPGDKEIDISLPIEFLEDMTERRPLRVAKVPEGAVAEANNRLIAFLDPLSDTKAVQLEIEDGIVTVKGTLNPKSTLAFRLLIPGWEIEPHNHVELLGDEHLIDRLEPYWSRVLAPAMFVEIPDKFLQNLIRASMVYCLIAARNEDKGGRIAPWIASMSYGPLESEANSIILGMCLMGFEEFTRRSLEFFINRYSPEGYLTTGYTLVGTGWHLWSLGRFYELYRDSAWMKSVAPKVAKVCDWIIAQREKTKRVTPNGQKVPEYGLVPPGVLADWGLYAYHYCLEGYYYAGLKWAAEALHDIGHPKATHFLADAATFREEIERAYHWTQAMSPVVPLRDGTWVPSYPAQVYTFGPTADYYPGQDANRSWAYDVELGAHHLVPQGVLEASSREVEHMMDHMEDVQFLRDGWHDYPAEKSEADWFNLGGFAKMQPYYCRNAEIYALRDDVKPFVRSYFNTLASLVNTETLWFWEHFRNIGAWNKTHETGYFLQQTRFMLVMEHQNELWLAPLVTNNWMKQGMIVNVSNAPTKFGAVSYKIESHVEDGYIDAHIYPPKRTLPEAIVIRLRHPDGIKMNSVVVNGKQHKDFDPEKEIVRITDTKFDEIDVRVNY